jgi:hypothetical protein
LNEPNQRETDAQYVILFALRGADLLVLAESGRFRLPRLSVPRYQRTAQYLTEYVRTKFGLDAVSLFSVSASSVDVESTYQVMELVGISRSTFPGFEWLSVSSLDETQFEEPNDLKAIRKAHDQCGCHTEVSRLDRFGRFGWFTELTEWVQQEIQPLGLSLNGRFTQLNATPTFALVRFETNGPAVWFKAVSQPNLREYPITLAVCKYFPHHTTRVLASRDDWNSWLALEADGTHPGEGTEVEIWSKVAAALAEVQVSSIGSTLHLLEQGCRDARRLSLSSLVDNFFEVATEAMNQQKKECPPPLSRSQLLVLRTQLQDVLLEANQSEIPNTLGHLDFNMGNVVVSHNGCVFLDWAEACVGHPFLTFQYLLEHFRRQCSKENFREDALMSAYVSRWSSLFSQDEIAEALRISPLLAVFAYAACWGAWRAPAIYSSDSCAGYLRSLVRRMKSEADRLCSVDAIGSVPCHN